MERKCARCGKKYNRVRNERLCPECSFLNKHRICVKCGMPFAPSDDPKDGRRKCYECQPLRDAKGKRVKTMDLEIANAKKAGLSYGKYQQWKYMQQCKAEKMIRRINKEPKG